MYLRTFSFVTHIMQLQSIIDKIIIQDDVIMTGNKDLITCMRPLKLKI